MGSSNVHPISPAQRDALTAQADATGFVRFDAFMAVALYHPTEGYYRRNRRRIGQRPDADFFTASSLGPVFGELIVASCQHLLGAQNPADFTFVELGAEAGHNVLTDVAHPFAAVETLGVNDTANLSGACIVFSNELFDAQPCRRFRGTGDGWLELGVRLLPAGISEAERTVHDAPPDLPPAGPVDYHLDYPEAARALLGSLVAPTDWHGLFVAFDYGKPWSQLRDETPQGTVRAYHRHRQSNDLLAHMGQQDLTCHVCWDHLAHDLALAGFTPQPLRSQEAFLVNHAADALQRIMAEEATSLSPRKSGLMQLLHPSSLGQKFQVLAAERPES